MSNFNHLLFNWVVVETCHAPFKHLSLLGCRFRRIRLELRLCRFRAKVSGGRSPWLFRETWYWLESDGFVNLWGIELRLFLLCQLCDTNHTLVIGFFNTKRCASNCYACCFRSHNVLSFFGRMVDISLHEQIFLCHLVSYFKCILGAWRHRILVGIRDARLLNNSWCQEGKPCVAGKLDLRVFVFG